MNSWNQNQNQNNMVMGQAQFNPYFNTYGQQRPPVYRADPIQGENAAWAFPIGGGDIWLPDANQDLIWWIRVDQNGNKQVKPFDIKPHEEPAPADINDILARLDALEERLNGKQSKSNAKRNVSTAVATATVDPNVTVTAN